MKTKRKISPHRISPYSFPKLDKDQNKKGLQSKIVRFLDQNYVKIKKKKFFTQILSFCVLKLSAQVTKGGAMPQFCILFYANYTILVTQRGDHATMPPPKYAPGSTVLREIAKRNFSLCCYYFYHCRYFNLGGEP